MKFMENLNGTVLTHAIDEVCFTHAISKLSIKIA